MCSQHILWFAPNLKSPALYKPPKSLTQNIKTQLSLICSTQTHLHQQTVNNNHDKRMLSRFKHFQIYFLYRPAQCLRRNTAVCISFRLIHMCSSDCSGKLSSHQNVCTFSPLIFAQVCIHWEYKQRLIPHLLHGMGRCEKGKGNTGRGVWGTEKYDKQMKESRAHRSGAQSGFIGISKSINCVLCWTIMSTSVNCLCWNMSTVCKIFQYLHFPQMTQKCNYYINYLHPTAEF